MAGVVAVFWAVRWAARQVARERAARHPRRLRRIEQQERLSRIADAVLHLDPGLDADAASRRADAGAVLPVWGHRRADGAAESRARSRHAQLGHWVETVSGRGEPSAERALQGAAERWRTAGSVLASAAAAEEFRVAERVAAEGLALVTRACAALNVPGPSRVPFSDDRVEKRG